MIHEYKNKFFLLSTDQTSLLVNQMTAKHNYHTAHKDSKNDLYHEIVGSQKINVVLGKNLEMQFPICGIHHRFFMKNDEIKCAIVYELGRTTPAPGTKLSDTNAPMSFFAVGRAITHPKFKNVYLMGFEFSNDFDKAFIDRVVAHQRGYTLTDVIEKISKFDFIREASNEN